MKTPLLLLLAACASASTLTITSGRIEAGWALGDPGGLDISLTGDGVSIGALIDHNTSLGLLTCGPVCGINVITTPGTPSFGNATIGNIQSRAFLLTFATRDGEQWSGQISFSGGSFDLTGFSIPTPVKWSLINYAGVRDFIFTDPVATTGGGPVVASPSLTLDSPEPSAILPISLALLLLNRHRARRQCRAA